MTTAPPPRAAEAAPDDPALSYLPAWFLGRLPERARPDGAPPSFGFRGGCLLADLSGFTRLTQELLEVYGPQGCDELSGILNAVFAPLVERILAAGGVVVKFAGDSILAVFPVDAETREADERAALRTARCALELVRMARTTRQSQEHRLALHAGVAFGDLLAVRVGGHEERDDIVVLGEPIRALGDSVTTAGSGEVVLEARAESLLRGRARVRSREQGHVLLRLDRPRASERVRQPAGSPGTTGEHHTLLPTPLRHGRASTGELWLAELRSLTLLFVALDGFPADSALFSQRLHQAVVAFQVALARRGGDLDKVCIDDKGVVLIGAFGLPGPRAVYETHLAVDAACASHAELARAGFACSVGVATGRMFCGLLGGSQRSEYTFIGDAAIRAARLMGRARGGVLCDAATERHARERYRFGDPTSLRLKNLSEEVAAFEPIEARGGAPWLRRDARRPFFGRSAELARVRQRIATLTRDGTGGAILIEGEAGIGKSSLLAEALADWPERRFSIGVGGGGPVSRDEPWSAWRPILRGLLAPGEEPAPAGIEASLREHLAAIPDGLERAALLNPLLGESAFPESDLTRGMAGGVRAENTRDLLALVLRRLAGERPLVLALEDVHWVDSNSWLLVSRLSGASDPILLLLTTRPVSGRVRRDLEALAARPGVEKLALASLEREHLERIVAEQLRVAGFDEEALDCILRGAHGNPFFAREHAEALVTEGVLEADEGWVRSRLGPEGVERRALPATVQTLLQHRIDQLPADEQLTLKTAAVLGRPFSPELLARVRALEAATDDLPAHLGHLVDLELLVADSDGSYRFRHQYGQEAAYASMIRPQRERLHETAARYYEGAAEGAHESGLVLLAHHWDRTPNHERALHFLDAAGTHALRAGANVEAKRLLGRALERDEEAGRHAVLERSRRALQDRRTALTRKLAEASFGLGDMDAVAHWSRSALRSQWIWTPKGRAAWVLALLLQVARQLTHRLLPGALVRTRLARRTALLEAARACAQLSQAYYFHNNLTAMLASALGAVNLAERADRPSPVSSAFGMLGLVAGMGRMHRAADYYLSAAESASRSADEPQELALAWFYRGLYVSCFARWGEADAAVAAGLRPARAIRSATETGLLLTLSGTNALYRGELGHTREAMTEVLETALVESNSQQQAWAENTLAVADSMGGDFATVVERTERSRLLCLEQRDLLSLIISDGLRCDALFRLGRLDESGALAREALARLMEARPTSWGALWGWAGPAQTFLGLASRDGEGDRARLLDEAGRATSELERFARVFPVGRPRAYTVRGQWHLASGRSERALRSLQKAARLSESYAMPFERGHSLLLLAGLLPAEADRLREEARGLLRPLSAEWLESARGEARRLGP